ncbi:MAG: M15 family metallopeptidase [Oscillospiraceae bacterium]|nr:M15 family metallopeptidase [Oscillospiraceae bacterium]
MAKNETERRGRKGLAAFCLGLLLLAGGGYGVVRLIGGMETIEADSLLRPEVTTAAVTTVMTDPNLLVCDYQTMFVSDITTGSLVLVNDTHDTKDLPKEKLVAVFEKRNSHVHVKDTTVKLQEEAMDAFNALADGFFNATGKDDLLVMNGYRTREEQMKIYNNNPQTAAKAGCSDYETGLALELRLFQGQKYSDFDGTGDYKWVLDHAAEYGFILRYPEGKKDKTGYEYSPAHLRYVGIPHASYMQTNGLCLEEYHEELNNHIYGTLNLPISGADGKDYIVYLFRVGETEDPAVDVPVPTGTPFTVSGNHIDGFVIAAEKTADMQSGTSNTNAVTTAVSDAQPAASSSSSAAQ